MHDRWILAKVESYEPKGNFYKLDVQPKAPVARVRLRHGGGYEHGQPIPGQDHLRAQAQLANQAEAQRAA